MVAKNILKALFDQKKIKILQVFIQKPQEEFTLKDIAKKSKVSLATTHRILKQLTKLNIVTQKKIKHLSLYKFSDIEEASFLSKLFYEKPAPIAKFLDLMSSIANIQQIVMHGKDSESKANIVIVGKNINKDKVNQVVAKLKEEDHYSIIDLVIEPEQFEVLSSMGQFSGSKTVLFSNVP